MSRSILILGGTRFVGRALATHLLAQGDRVTVSSRRPQSAPEGAAVEPGEREQAIARLAVQASPDIVLDFTAYDAAAAGQAMQAFPTADYLLVSSIWVTRMWPGAGADELVPGQATIRQPQGMPALTWRYVRNKAMAEAAVAAQAADEAGRRAARILRLPIMWGRDDHTGRLEFYLSRLLAGRLLLVDGGMNAAQIAWSQDVVRAVAAALPSLAQLPLLCEGLPGEALVVRAWIDVMARGCGRPARSFSVSSAQLQRECPAYLDHEPLWREQALPPTPANLFSQVGLASTDPGDWLPALSAQFQHHATAVPIPGEGALLDRMERRHA